VTATQVLDVRRNSIRVALAATGIVGAAYLMVAIAVVLTVTNNLTAQIDQRLTSQLSHWTGTPGPGPSDGGPGGGGGGDRPFGPPTLSWRIDPSGTVSYIGPSNYAFQLPASYTTIASPQTVTLSDTQFRIAGRQIGDDYFVVAQELDSVADTQGTLIRAEALIGPLLLLVVFLGAVAIGRRVASPVERERQRQMEFTADASHELRTPLSVIEAQTSLALAQNRSEEWYRTAFTRVDKESKRMRRLVDDLLWLARFDATQRPPTAEPVDLGIVAAQAADRFAVIAETRHLRLDVSTRGEDLVVGAPAEWLDRLLGVLIDNACKYSPDAGTVAVTVTTDAGRIRLTVDDSGPGIPEDERGRIFDRFHRATEAKSGAGLGLAIADAIVRATGGRWQVGNSPAGGARMSVGWPPAFGAHRQAQGSLRSRVGTATPD
jgi:signal transduction histidine kinase